MPIYGHSLSYIYSLFLGYGFSNSVNEEGACHLYMIELYSIVLLAVSYTEYCDYMIVVIVYFLISIRVMTSMFKSKSRMGQ